LIEELYRQSPLSLPDPATILGELNNPNREAWPLYEDDDREPCLRETDEYKHLLFNFLKEVSLNSDYRKDSASKVLSDYVDTTLEAYLVLTYINSYDNWKTEGEASYESPTRRFTERGRGSGKFKGWNEDGIDLYNMLVDVITKQREDKSKPELVQFEIDLMKLFVEAKKGAGIGGVGRVRKRARNSVSEALSGNHKLVKV
jgi:hypothetical protein